MDENDLHQNEINNGEETKNTDSVPTEETEPSIECPILSTDEEQTVVEEKELDDLFLFPDEKDNKGKEKNEKKVSYGFLASVLCIAVAFTVIFTYTFAMAAARRAYTDSLIAKQQEINALQAIVDSTSQEESALATVRAMLEKYSYYTDSMSEEEMINAAVKAYVAATGDKYAAYYTVEEYAALQASTVSYAGIGAYTLQSTLDYQGVGYLGYLVGYCYLNSPAQAAGIQTGDFIYQIKVDGVFCTVEELGGYESALKHIQGEENTTSEIAILRDDGSGNYVRIEFSMQRKHIEDPAVYSEYKDGDTKTAVVWIKQFNQTTPSLFRAEVDRLLAAGVEHFVFDVRNNPGGDLRSIKSVLSYFLNEGDTIIQTVDKNGNVVDTVVAEPETYTGAFANCSVTREEIGIYKNLDFTVLCNESTASAAEVFVATLRDFGMTKVVGTTTFGKGVMQTVYDISKMNSKMSGYLKVTSHAYVTKCGQTYHDMGITPTEGYYVALSQTASKYHLYSLYGMEQSLDNQLQAAFSVFSAQAA